MFVVKFTSEQENTALLFEDVLDACQQFTYWGDYAVDEGIKSVVSLIERVENEDGSTIDYPHFEVYY